MGRIWHWKRRVGGRTREILAALHPRADAKALFGLLVTVDPFPSYQVAPCLLVLSKDESRFGVNDKFYDVEESWAILLRPMPCSGLRGSCTVWLD